MMKQGKCFNDLPSELLLEIFSYLDIENLALSVQHVNSCWKEVSQDDRLWRDAFFKPGEAMSDDEIIRHLKNMPVLRAFSVTREANMKLLIDTLCKFCTDIKHLELHKAHTIRLDSLRKVIQCLPHIAHLSLPLPKMMSIQLRCALLIGQCKSLVSLSFENCHGYVVEGMLQIIADGCPSLQHIYLGYGEFCAPDIKYVLEKKKHQLKSFSMKLFLFVALFRSLSECRKLEYLHIENSNANLAYYDIEPLKELVNLKYFALHYCTESVACNLPFFFQHKLCLGVVHLDLSHNFTIHNSDLSGMLQNLALLRYLNLSSSHHLEDDGFKDISNCRQLEHLNISRCDKLTDRCIEYVNRAHYKLKYLNISSCDGMTDNVVKHLVKCRKLCVLKIGFNKLKGTNFHLFATHLMELKELHIDYCDSLEKSVIRKMYQDMPQLKIIHPIDYEKLELKDTLFSVIN